MVILVNGGGEKRVWRAMGLCLGLWVTAMLIGSGCAAPAPVVAVQTPEPPPPAYVTYAPDYYVWDGDEYVGVSGGQYVYWSGSAWLVAPPVIIGHFHGWERYHPAWRRHAHPYHRGRERYR